MVPEFPTCWEGDAMNPNEFGTPVRCPWTKGNAAGVKLDFGAVPKPAFDIVLRYDIICSGRFYVPPR
jgi:hypothetical protein